MLIRIIFLLVISLPVYAIEDGKVLIEKEPENFCLDKQSAIDNENLARKNADDDLLVKVVALRAGLCDLIDKKIIGLDFAIDLFDNEHSKLIRRRIEEDQSINWEIGA
jgi:hypothetical protein